MAHDIRNTDSKSRATARTKIDENLDEIGDYLRDLIHEAAGTDELRLQAETNRILAAFKAGLAQPGARITVIVGNTILDPSNNGAGLATPPMLGGAPAPLVLGPGSNPAPLAPAPTASIEEQLGARLVQTFDADEAFKLLDGAVSRNMRTAVEVLNCVDAFEPARQSRQYSTLLAYATQVATAIASGDVLRNTGSDIVPGSLQTKITNAQSATQIVESNLDLIVQDVFGGIMPSFQSGSNEKVDKTRQKIAELRQEGAAFENELATHTGVSRNGDTVQTYVQRALTGRRTITGTDLDALGDAIGIKRDGKSDDDYRNHMIDEIKKERQTANDYRAANNLAVVGNWTIGRLYTDLLDQKSGGFLGGGGRATIKFPVVNP